MRKNKTRRSLVSARAAAFAIGICSPAVVPVSHAAPLTADAVAELPASTQGAWREYLQRSATAARADQAALDAELAAHGMTQALPAPSGGDFKLSAKPGDAWFSSDEAGRLADVVLSWQTPSGGWSKHTGYSKGARKPGMLWSSQYQPGAPPHYLGTFDNRSTTEQLQFLAGVARATGREDCIEGFRKGLSYIFSSQYPNGGWPQVYPLEGGYHDNITLNDDALAHILGLLHGITSEDPEFSFVTEAERTRAAAAMKRGIDCVLAMQVVQDGKRTGWGAQHDPLTLAPAAARAMEPASLASIETANLLKVLMNIRDPEPGLVTCIEHGLDWLDRVKIEDGKTRWARFYDLRDSRPIFPGRDGVIYGSFDEMAKHNKLGYDFYSGRPGSVVKNGRKKWRKMLASRK